ncbi:hypothetical protein [Mycolicibacter minnesotensis]
MATSETSRQALFAALLKRAATHGHRVPPGVDLNPAVLDAINTVADSWPRVPAMAVNRAQTTFARSELTRASAAKPTTPISLDRPPGTHRRGPAENP